jgi:hypothetical protein
MSQQGHPDTGRSECVSERLRQDRQISDMIESGSGVVESLLEVSIPLKLCCLQEEWDLTVFEQINSLRKTGW